MKTLFKESQKFRQWWLWILLLTIVTISTIGFYLQITTGKPLGTRPMSDSGFLVVIVFLFILLILFWFLELKTNITKEGIEIKYFPFVNRKVKWSELQSAKVIDYGFVGGWGIRFPTKYGVVYNTQGSKGLAIVQKNGKKFLIGTQKEYELKDVVSKYSIND